MNNITNSRFEGALQNKDINNALLELAKELKNEGVSKTMLLKVFDDYREKYSDNSESSEYNAILDVMDFISGYSSPHMKLYD